MPSDFLKDLVDHKARVAKHLHNAAIELIKRAIVHDNSKFSPEEYEAYEAAFSELQKYAYGSDEFKAALATIQPAIQHHYAVNSHHPEHFENGINDMTLVQLIEMLCDWKAASERSQTDRQKGMLINKGRFGIGDQLFGILQRTLIAMEEKP